MSGDLFSDAGFQLPQTAAPAPAAAPAGSLFQAAGFALPGSAPPKPTGQFSDEIPIPVPGQQGYHANLNETPDNLENRIASFTAAIDPINIANTVRKTWWDATKDAASSSASQYQTGLHQLGQSMTGAGVGNTALGALGTVASPLTGAFNTLGAGVTQLTGNPAIGDTAAALAGFALPIKGGTQAAKLATEGNALNTIVRTVGPENVPALVADLKANPRLSLMDKSDPLRVMAQGLIDPAQPEAQNIITQNVKNRMATLPAATNSAYTAAMGPAPDVVKMVQGLKDNAAQVGKNLIEPAIDNADPIPIKPLLRTLDKQIGSPEAIAGETPRIPLDPTQIKLLNLRNQITNGEMAPLNERIGLSVGPINDALKSGTLGQSRTDDFTEARRLLNSARRGYTSEDDLVSGLKDLADNQKIVTPIDDAVKMIQKGPVEYRGADFLHGVQSRLREYAQNLSQSSVGSERAMSSDLFSARDNLVNAIDKASGGQYRQALSKYRDAMQIQDAFEGGFDTLKNRSGMSGLEDRPEAMDEWIKNATPEQIVARRLGTRADIDQKLRGVKNQGLAGQNITSIEYNQEKLRSLFGNPEANRLIGAMNDTAAEAKTNSKILEGSKTAETLAGQRALEVRKIGGGNFMNWAGMPLAEMAGEYTSGSPGLGAALYGGVRAAQLGTQYGLRAVDRARNVAFAKAVSASGGPQRDQVLTALLLHPDVARASQKTGNALTAP